jgi:hypothetical protein
MGGNIGVTQWEYGFMYYYRPFIVRWIRSTMVLNKSHYGSWIE